jgi:hypothetical protein
MKTRKEEEEQTKIPMEYKFKKTETITSWFKQVKRREKKRRWKIRHAIMRTTLAWNLSGNWKKLVNVWNNLLNSPFTWIG